jgi:hypothetical protein
VSKVSARRPESEKARNPQASPTRPIDEHFTGELGEAALLPWKNRDPCLKPGRLSKIWKQREACRPFLRLIPFSASAITRCPTCWALLIGKHGSTQYGKTNEKAATELLTSIAACQFPV